MTRPFFVIVEQVFRWAHYLQIFLLASVAFFHLANAPILPVTALYIKQLGGSSELTTFTVLSAQLVMVPMAWETGRLCDSWGKKPIMAVAFWVLHSDRRTKPFIVVNCAALPENLIESELFSYEKGAFTGALNRKAGKFESARGRNNLPR